MKTITLTLTKPIPRQLLADVEDKLPFCSQALLAFKIDPGRSDVIELEVSDDADEEEVAQKAERLVLGMVAGWRELPVKVKWDGRHNSPPGRSDPWQALIDSEEVVPMGQGQVALQGRAMALATYFDRRFQELADLMGARPAQYPQMIPVATLDRCQYFSSFPHHVTFCSHLTPDVDLLAAFARPRPAGEPPPLAAGLATPTHALNPAMCFHTYATLADRPLRDNLCFTTIGRCFRYEAGALTTLERLWDFSMREVIFVGGQAFVKACRDKTLEWVANLSDELGLSAWIETANDPFFMTNFVAKKYHQMLTDAKFELRLTLPQTGRSLAAASFNYHENFFGRSYGMTVDGGLAHTACTAFGIERWVYALISQYGMDDGAWPAPIRAALRAGQLTGNH